MKKFELTLKEYIEDKLGCWLNRKKTEIIYDQFVIVCCTYSGHNPATTDTMVEMISESDTLAEFIRKFEIQCIDDFELIDDRALYILYLKGKAEIVCIIDGYNMNSLHFKRANSEVYAKDDENEEHLVQTDLQDANDYIRYTRQYFLNKHILYDKL